MLFKGKVLMNSCEYKNETNIRFKNPTEIFLNDELLRLSGMLSDDKKRDVKEMSDFEKFALVCSSVGRGKGIRLIENFIEEIFCVFTLIDEREYIDSLIIKSEINSHNASELWRKLCMIFGNVDAYCCDEKNKSNNKYQDKNASENAVEKNNNITYSIDIEEILKSIPKNAENMVDFADELFKSIENKGISDIVIRIKGQPEFPKTDKYHCSVAFEKYRDGEILCTDEKFSLYYGLIYQIISKKSEQKLQLNIIFDNTITASNFVDSIAKSFPNICLSNVISIGFDSSFQEKNIAEYFYSANNNHGIFPIFLCHKNIPEAELSVSLLRLSRIFPLDCMTFITENEGSSKKLYECIRSLRAFSNK